jgi:hypothetical protein
MSMIMTRCPETGAEISAEIECDAETFKKLPFVVMQIMCPRCGHEHSWSKSEAWLSQSERIQTLAKQDS